MVHVTTDLTRPSTDRRPDGLLDNPVWHALTGPQAGLAEGADVGSGLARRYREDVSVFAALADVRDPQSWADLAAILGPGGQALITGDGVAPPDGWGAGGGPGVQLVETDRVDGVRDPEVVTLRADDPADVDAMVDLVALTNPGPFRRGTPLMGSYLGIRRGGRLVAMAGERMHPDGWTEISAVATHPDHRRQGLSGRLVRSVVAGVRARGERTFMHAAASNTGAIGVYLGLGFELRRETTFRMVRAPE